MDSKVFAMGGGERAIAEAVVGALKGDGAFFSSGEQGGFERGFHGFETGVAEDGFAAPAFPAFKGEA